MRRFALVLALVCDVNRMRLFLRSSMVSGCLVLVACPGRPGDGDTAGSTTSATMSETPSGSSGSTDASDGGNGGTGNSSGESPTTGATSGESTGGAPMSGCESLFEAYVACRILSPEDEAQYLEACEAMSSGGDDACVAAADAMAACFSGLSCEELAVDLSACQPAIAQQEFTCLPADCVTHHAVDPEGGCSFDVQCPESDRWNMVCDEERCFCLWMDEPPGGEASCESMGVCSGDAEAIGLHFFSCCGFAF